MMMPWEVSTKLSVLRKSVFEIENRRRAGRVGYGGRPLGRLPKYDQFAGAAPESEDWDADMDLGCHPCYPVPRNAGRTVAEFSASSPSVSLKNKWGSLWIHSKMAKQWEKARTLLVERARKDGCRIRFRESCHLADASGKRDGWKPET
ncbi:unnamed protein product [Larinioides sclopetarius]|uniref:Uncharacterized protein n=1 Tax=Larinioides sclopetarius TaxID=280406 RepID=A0AAV1YPT2_9ARAC